MNIFVKKILSKKTPHNKVVKKLREGGYSSKMVNGKVFIYKTTEPFVNKRMVTHIFIDNG